MASAEEAAEAIRAGALAIVPTDTVYGLAADPRTGEPVRRLYRAKGRRDLQPTALLAADVDVLLELVPELAGRAEAIARALLPGAYTLVLPNPAGRLPWLAGARPDTIGVRVPHLTGPAAKLLALVGALAATSANLPGGPDPCRLADVPEELRAAAAALLDGGELPGTPSTVLDLTGPEPVVLREGAVTAADALWAVARVL